MTAEQLTFLVFCIVDLVTYFGSAYVSYKILQNL